MLLNVAVAEPVAVDLQIASTNAQTLSQLSWASDGDTFYEIWTSTNLADSAGWTLATDYPIISSNLAAQVQILSADTSRFFKVAPADTQGPVLVARYPAAGDANVGLTAVFSISVSDPSGVNTNAFRLTVNGGSPLTCLSAGMTVTETGFTFDPSLASTNWGVNGSTVTVAFACSDLKGNTTYETWSFYLAVPVTVANNILVLGSTPALSYSVAPPSKTALRPLAANPGSSVTPLPSDLSIVAIYADRIVVAYTGDTHGIALGTLLANNDFDNIFYRKVTGLSDNTATKRVTVYTQDVPFTQLITQGSMDSGDFVWVGSEEASPLSSSGQTIMPLATFEKSVTYSQSGFYEVLMDWGPVSFDGSASFSLTGGMFFSTEIQELKVTQISAGVNANLDVALNASLTFDATTEPVDESMPLIEDSIRLGKATAYVYGIPVRVSLYLDLELCVESESSGSVTLSAGASANANFSYRLNYNPETQWTKTSDGSFTYSIPPVTLSGGMEGQAYVYVKPTLTVRLYEAVGIAVDYCRGPKVTGAFMPSEGRYEFGLYDKRVVNLGLWCADLPEFLEGLIDTENLPSWELWSKETPILTWYWPQVALSAPSFTKHPASGTYASGAAVTLSVSASGNPSPSYQWYQNGTLLVGKTGQSLTFTMGSSAIGTYTCKAINSRGSVTSQSAAVSLQQSAPSGMALISAGSFQMGDSLDNYTQEKPVHTVYVSGFYMDKYEVTKAKWDEVANWAASNGYDLTAAGAAGVASSHPAQTMTWFRAVKWCNARSQKEGLTPCYTVGGAVYKTGDSAPDCNWAANGYRLPTEAEWEKAARGGLSSRRFPWGDTIQHSKANYGTS
jgi:hypothetical protein